VPVIVSNGANRYARARMAGIVLQGIIIVGP